MRSFTDTDHPSVPFIASARIRLKKGQQPNKTGSRKLGFASKIKGEGFEEINIFSQGASSPRTTLQGLRLFIFSLNTMEDEEEQWKADDPAAETSQSYQESLEGEGEESVEDVHNSPQPGTQSRFRLRSKSPSNSGRGVRFAKGGSTTNLHAGPSGSLSSTASTLSLSKQRSAPTSAKTRVAVSLQQTVKKSADDELPKNNGDDDDDELWNGSDGYGTDEFEEDVDGGDTNPSNLSIAVDVDMDEDAFERELGKSIARGGGHGSNKFRSNGSAVISGDNVAREFPWRLAISSARYARGHARQQSTPGSHVSTGQSPYGLTASQGSLYSADFEEFDEDDSIHRSISRSRSRKPSPPKTKSTSPSHSSMYRATSGHHYKQSSARNGNSSSSSMPSATGRNGSASASEGGGKRAPPALSRYGSLSSADGGLVLVDLSIDASAPIRTTTSTKNRAELHRLVATRGPMSFDEATHQRTGNLRRGRIHLRADSDYGVLDSPRKVSGDAGICGDERSILDQTCGGRRPREGVMTRGG